MITTEKLRIYQHYSGDIDGWARRVGASEKENMTDQDWGDINDLIHRLYLEKSVPVAESFRAETAQLIAERISDPTVIEQLRSLAK